MIESVITTATVSAASYILGSVPFGFIVALLVKGIDIRNFGSGNIGATNVLRVVGKPWGILVFILDFLKGFLAVVVSRLLFSDISISALILSGLAAVCGHNWPLFLKFKGGKGVATSAGVILGLGFAASGLRSVLIFSLAAWIVVLLITRIVSLASIIAVIVFLSLSWIFNLPFEVKVFSFVLSFFIILRHKENIRRLLEKKEHRF
jgi:glycerol-3-phosphate acyltransferase PlsY